MQNFANGRRICRVGGIWIDCRIPAPAFCAVSFLLRPAIAAADTGVEEQAIDAVESGLTAAVLV